jgi:hypothetical protein
MLKGPIERYNSELVEIDKLRRAFYKARHSWIALGFAISDKNPSSIMRPEAYNCIGYRQQKRALEPFYWHGGLKLLFPTNKKGRPAKRATL